jgi:hypothetical protein
MHALMSMHKSCSLCGTSRPSTYATHHIRPIGVFGFWLWPMAKGVADLVLKDVLSPLIEAFICFKSTAEFRGCLPIPLPFPPGRSSTKCLLGLLQLAP